MKVNTKWPFALVVYTPKPLRPVHTKHTDLLIVSDLPSDKMPSKKKWVHYAIESEGISDTDTDTEAVCTISVYYYEAKNIGR